MTSASRSSRATRSSWSWLRKASRYSTDTAKTTRINKLSARMRCAIVHCPCQGRNRRILFLAKTVADAIEGLDRIEVGID